jgi:hypothetical protein
MVWPLSDTPLKRCFSIHVAPAFVIGSALS